MMEPKKIETLARLRGKRRLARFILVWETLWPLIWPPLATLSLFVGLSLLQVPQAIGHEVGGPWQGLILALFLAVFLWQARRAVTGYSGPDEESVRRRIEEDTGASHRPLTLLEDKLSNAGDRMSRVLWVTHRERMLTAMGRWRVGPPRPIWAAVDQFGLRAVVTLLLIIGFTSAWGETRARMVSALTVDFALGNPAAPPSVDLWVNPPSYTGQHPILVRHGGEVQTVPASQTDPADAEPETLAVPIGSRVLATVNGGEEVPQLVLVSSDEQESVTAFSAIGSKGGLRGYQYEGTLNSGAVIVVRQAGEELLRRQLNVLPDLKPTVAFNAPPSQSQRQALVIKYGATDDYGVASIKAEIRRVAGPAEMSSEDPITIALPLSAGDRSELAGQSFTDLTPHPWAGQPVMITLRALDDLKQEGRSEPVQMVLPERIFNHPVARAVIEQRKRLVVEPTSRRDVAKVLMAIAARPQHYYDDTVVFLALKSASARSFLNEDDESLESILKLLWDTALRIEDGELSIAARELREIERRLQEALANNASLEDIEKLIEELRQAIDKMLQAMARQMMEQQARDQQPQAGEQQPMDPENMLRRKDIMDMLNRAREMAKGGARDAARQLLSQLQEMMENLRMGKRSKMSPEQQAMQEMMRQLSEMQKQQQKLLDDTYKMNQQNMKGMRSGPQGSERFGKQGQKRDGQRRSGQRRSGEPRSGRQGERRFGQRPEGQQSPGQGRQNSQPTAEDLARMQEQLRRTLGEFMRKLGDGMGEIPKGFGQAERSMKNAGEALGKGDPAEAVGPEGDALDQMAKGGRALSQELRRRMANGQRQGQPGAQGQQGGPEQERDPLNRNRAGNFGVTDKSNVKVPGESDMMRARRIFDELRRRSGDRARPRLELDYIDRLLRRF